MFGESAVGINPVNVAEMLGGIVAAFAIFKAFGQVMRTYFGAGKADVSEVAALSKAVAQLTGVVTQMNRKVTPNGKDTQNVGDIVARVEDKLDAALEKIDVVDAKVDHHLGWHDGRQDFQEVRDRT